MRFLVRWSAALAAVSLLTACAGGGAIQPDRSIFSLDNNYQRFSYSMAIEETFDRTVSVFREGGYKLDVIDRATGQISGRRGATGDKGLATDKGLKFYALVLPNNGGSELSIKIVQIISSGGVPVINSSKSELIVTEPQMYRYVFQRVENSAKQQSAPPAFNGPTSSPGELPAGP